MSCSARNDKYVASLQRVIARVNALDRLAAEDDYQLGEVVGMNREILIKQAVLDMERNIPRPRVVMNVNLSNHGLILQISGRIIKAQSRMIARMRLSIANDRPEGAKYQGESGWPTESNPVKCGGWIL